MTTEMQAMQSLLLEICDLGAVTEEKGITKPPPFSQLIQKARDLGIGVPGSATLDDLRAAVESACTNAMAGDTAGDNPIQAKMILGNETGMPGDGP